jgi:hypothetical protein
MIDTLQTLYPTSTVGRPTPSSYDHLSKIYYGQQEYWLWHSRETAMPVVFRARYWGRVFGKAL